MFDETFESRFRVLHEAGQGGMAQVWKAERLHRGAASRTVALKRMLPNLSSSLDAETLFRDEARIGSLFEHPNIVRCEEHGCDSAGPYLALEWVDGLSLREMISRAQAPLPVRVAVSILVDVLRGLAAMHDHRVEGRDGRLRRVTVLHRDVSPSNILIDRDGTAKLADFGLARALDRSRTSPPGTITGKLAYLPPEAFERRATGTRGDTYAVGVCAFEALAGRRLFMDASTDAELVAWILRAPRPRLETAAAGTNADVCRVVDRAIAFDPADRYATATEFADELTAAARHAGEWTGRACVAEFLQSVRDRPSWTGTTDAVTRA